MSDSTPIDWRFASGPQKFSGEEFWLRYGHPDMPEKFEATDGKLFWDDAQRFHVLGMLIETLGLDAVERFIGERRSVKASPMASPTFRWWF